jgi:hypothetical protein
MGRLPETWIRYFGDARRAISELALSAKGLNRSRGRGSPSIGRVGTTEV